MADASPTPDDDDGDAARAEHYEHAHVHAVYDAIAPHFSATRYKPWPVISRFLAAQPAGSIGLDAGCGNGKNARAAPAHIPLLLASDRSAALARLAAAPAPGAPGHDALVADLLALPHPSGRFDFALAVAVLHHLSTRARRVAALAELLRPLRRGRGRALVVVWALEQPGSRRGWRAGDKQDVMVPWVMRAGKGAEEEGDGGRTFQRFYHLYREGELAEDIRAAGGAVVEGGYDRDNWWAVAAPGGA